MRGGLGYHAGLMDWNTLLLWIAGSSALTTLFTAARASPKSKGWIGVGVALGAIGGAAYSVAPNAAGYVAGGLWAMFILAPSLLQRSVRQATLRQNYRRASTYSVIAGILHPFDGLPQQARFLRAIAMAERGDLAAASATLADLEAHGSPHIARAAAIHLRRINHDWAGVIAWVQANIEPAWLLRDINMLPIYVRALGELGRLSEMLHVCAAGQLSDHPMLAIHRSSTGMFVLAFCGNYPQVIDMLDGPLSQMPGEMRRYWIATSKFAAGLVPEARRELEDLQAVATPGLRLAIEKRLAHPPVVATSVLTAADLTILRQIGIQQEHEQRFAHFARRAGRPWVTYSLIAANVMVFAVEWSMGAHPGNYLLGGTESDAVLHRLGDMNPDVLKTHEYYRLFMANFLHAGYAHILMNMFGLLILGPFVERSLGRLVYLALYLVCGVGVMVTVLFLESHHLMPDEELVGASGAIMAVIGATAAILLRGWYRERAAFALRRLRAVGLIVVLQVVFDHFTPQVSGAAHIVGVVWGFVLAGLIPLRKKTDSSEGRQS